MDPSISAMVDQYAFSPSWFLSLQFLLRLRQQSLSLTVYFPVLHIGEFAQPHMFGALWTGMISKFRSNC